MTSIFDRLKERLSEARNSMATYYNRKRRDIPGFKKKDLVMLNGKNIRSKGRCRKLEDKMYGQFEVISEGHNRRYCKLRLPDSWTIHPVFNIALLERYRGKDPGKQTIEIEADDSGWKMERIIASGSSNDDVKKYVYLVKWEGFSQDENSWKSYETVEESAYELLKEYHEKNPIMEKDGRFAKRKEKEKEKEKKTILSFLFFLLCLLY
jgi:hypothetical protein